LETFKRIGRKLGFTIIGVKLQSVKKINYPQPSVSFFAQIVKQFVSARAAKKKMQKNSTLNPSEVSIFTFPFGTWNKEMQQDYVFSNLHQYTKTKTRVNYIPVILSLNDFIAIEKWEKGWDANLLNYFPNWLDFIGFTYSHYKFLKKIKKIELRSSEKDAFLDENILRVELSNIGYHNHGFLFFYMWLKKYFKTGIGYKKKLFYQDEFYQTGRMISHAQKAAGNSNIFSFGVQHGLFFEGHTVYALTDSEITGKNALPLPDKFIVWGNFFKQIFLKNNSNITIVLIQ
jgi:hypothetical protein